MIESKLTINNKAGIHCRPSAAIMAAVNNYSDCDFLLSTKNGETKLESILELLSLAITYEDKVTLTTSGQEENEANLEVAELLEREFDFPTE